MFRIIISGLACAILGLYLYNHQFIQLPVWWVVYGIIWGVIMKKVSLLFIAFRIPESLKKLIEKSQDDSNDE